MLCSWDCLTLWNVLGIFFLYLLSGTALISAPESILTGSDLHPCLVIICNIVWKEVCPSYVVSARRLSSVLEKDDLWVMWLIWHVCGDEVLWLHVRWSLLLVAGFLGMFKLPFIMFSNCLKAVIMSFSCIGTHCLSKSTSWFCQNNWFCLSKWVVSLFTIVDIWEAYVTFLKFCDAMYCNMALTFVVLWRATQSWHVLSPEALGLMSCHDWVESRRNWSLDPLWAAGWHEHCSLCPGRCVAWVQLDLAAAGGYSHWSSTRKQLYSGAHYQVLPVGYPLVLSW